MTTKLQAKLYADLVGKPFLRGGRGPDAYDCWGVLQCVLRRLGHTPTDFPSRPELLRYALQDEWQPLEKHEIRPGDGILLRSIDPAYEWHVGLVLDRCWMLHAADGIGVVTERFDSPAHVRRIAGFYRFRGRPE